MAMTLVDLGASVTRLRASGIARAFARTFGVSLLARLAQVALAVALVRALGSGGYGLFLFATGAAVIGGRVGALGWPNLMLRFLPAYRTQQDWAHLRGLLQAAPFMVGLGALLAAGVLVGIAVGLGPAHRLSPGLWLAAGLTPVIAFRALRRSQLAALGHPARGVFVDEAFGPLLLLAALALAGFTLAPETAVLGYGVAGVIAVALGMVWLVPRVPPEAAATPAKRQTWVWTLIAAPTLVGMSAKLLMTKTDVLMLAPLGSFADVGLYGAAARLILIQTMPILILNSVVMPRISAALAAGKTTQARKLFWGSVIFALAGSLPFALVFWGVGGPLMAAIFGPDFASGGAVLAVLGAAQVFGALSAPTSAFLVVSGRQAAFGALTFLALAVNIAGNLILIPSFGALGAAWASLAAMALLVVLQGAACGGVLRR